MGTFKNRVSTRAFRAKETVKHRLASGAGNALDTALDGWAAIPHKVKVVGGGVLVTAGVAGGLYLGLRPHMPDASFSAFNNGKFTYQPGETMLRDGNGNPALMSYFGERVGDNWPTLTVSLATQLPEHFHDGSDMADTLDAVTNHAQSTWSEVILVPVQTCTTSNNVTSCTTSLVPETIYHTENYDYPLEISEDFVPINQQQANELRAYFAEFERLTGIHIDVALNNPDANITIANYQNAPDHIEGSLDWVNPNEVSSVPESVDGHGFASDNGFVLLNNREYSTIHHANQLLGTALGFSDGKVNIAELRAGLRHAGLDVPDIAGADTIYDLGEHLNPGSRLLPNNEIFDNGGRNTLTGTDGNDILLSGESQCGFTGVPRTILGSAFGDGDKYCIIEGEFELVRGGSGNDFIIVAPGDTQRIAPGPGHNSIQFFTPDMGDKIILAGQDEGHNNLVFHQSIFERGDVTVSQDIDHMTITFTATGGRHIGSIQFDNGTVDRIVVLDDNDHKIVNKDISDIRTSDGLTHEFRVADRKVADAITQRAREELHQKRDAAANPTTTTAATDNDTWTLRTDDRLTVKTSGGRG